MSMNIYKVKKWAAGAMMSFMPIITFLLMIIFTEFVQSLIAIFIVIPISILIGFRIMDHPVHKYLEGQGLMVLTFDSTGTIETYIVNVNNPYISGQYRGKKAETIFDRNSIFYMGAPQEVNGIPEDNPNYEILKLQIPKDKKNEHFFGFNQFPVLIYNKNLETFLTKELLANIEKDTFVKHMILYLNRKVEDLTASLRDFARHIVEQTRPKKSFLESLGPMKWILIIVVLGILMALLAPTIMETMGLILPAADTAKDSIINAVK